MSSVIYKSFDSSDFLFENLWRFFPNIIAKKGNSKQFIKELVMSSYEFCKLLDKNYFSIKKITEGGFGIVGQIGNGNKIFKAAVFSYGPTKTNLFYVNVIAKIGKQILDNKIYRIDLSTISINDPLSDMVFGSALGHLYDLGVCPFIPKYFGTYLCENKKTTIIIETSDIEMLKIINRNSKNSIEPDDFKNVLVQYVYCLFILKHYFGAVHFDSHLRNIMLSNLIERDDYMYHGKSMKDISYIAFETGVIRNNKPVIIVAKRSKYLLKLIDFGCMVLYLDRSHIQKFKRDIRIETDVYNMKQIGAEDALINTRSSQSYANTVDLLFTLINLYQFMTLGLDYYRGPKDFSEHLDILNNLTFSLLGITMDSLIENNPTKYAVYRLNSGEYDWFMRNHSVGINSGFEDHTFLVKGLIRMCYKFETVKNLVLDGLENTNETIVGFMDDFITSSSVLSNENTLFLTHTATGYQKSFNRLERLINIQDRCNNSKDYDNVNCQVLKLYDQPPMARYSNDIDELVAYDFNNNVKIYIRNSTYSNNPTYHDYNSWLNSDPIPKEKLYKQIEDVRIVMISIKKINKAIIRKNDPLVKTMGLSLPIGMFVLFNKVPTPIGFYANDITNDISHIHIPNIYSEYIGVLTYNGNDLSIEKYNTFVNRHKYSLNQASINNTTQEQYKHIINPLQLIGGNKYNWAVTVGPILIWEGRNVFQDNLRHEKSDVVLYGNSSDKIFVGQNAGYYQMTDSHIIQAQLIYIESKHNKGFIFVEGDGYLTPGIDKFEAAKLCKNLGAVNAVCVQSGLYSNILAKKLHGKDRYLSKSPFRIYHGTVLDMSF
ncbi:serine/threonine protein kinase [Dasineura jujubifolia toursvirus 2a]|nr:serine/threonine protein kinase [Dasineura jujubifolia toursvirus 2a]